MTTAAPTEAQQVAIDAVLSGRSVFITGIAGSGKTFVLKHILGELDKVYRAEEILVTAMTGSSAANLGRGGTLHATFNLFLGKWTLAEHIAWIDRDPARVESICNCKVLVIDEFALMSTDVLLLMTQVLQHFRKDPRPFAGIQVVPFGDYLQMSYDNSKLPLFELDRPHSIWNSLHVVILQEAVRQKEDPAFIEFLNHVRLGAEGLGRVDIAMISQLMERKSWPNGVTPIELLATNIEVDNVNSLRLRMLLGDQHDFIATDIQHIPSQPLPLDTETNLLQLFSSKIGQPVVFLKNLPDHQLVNGSQGVVKGFLSRNEVGSYAVIGNLGEIPAVKYPLVQFSSKPSPVVVGCLRFEVPTASPRVSSPASRTQVPLRPAFALTVHRAQGMTLEYLIITATEMKSLNQFYTAISRAKVSKWVEVRGLEFNPRGDLSSIRKSLKATIKFSFDAAKFYKLNRPFSDAQKLNHKLFVVRNPEIAKGWVARKNDGEPREIVKKARH